jgi:GTP-binding protein HflX
VAAREARAGVEAGYATTVRGGAPPRAALDRRSGVRRRRTTMTGVSSRIRRASTAPRDPEPVGRERQRAFMIAVLPAGDDLSELRELLRTAGVPTVGQLVQHRDQAHPNTYLGPGKIEELRHRLAETGANVVACDDELTPRQERNLERALEAPVIDRTSIILDIFAGHAHTAEGKLQVELAQLQYNLARMRGLWTHLERLGAGAGAPGGGPGIGTRGPGESQIETDRRLARDRITVLRRRLERVKSARETMRAERSRARLPTIALVGYTNAGKSTLLNRLTGAEVGVRDRLFHTLDPTTRAWRLGGRDYLLTDTVGFIRKLPHQLVEAFGATLEETRLADLLLHVVDASAPADEQEAMMRAVDGVLEEIGAGDRPRLLVLNKVDALDDDARHDAGLRHPDALLVSAQTSAGLDELGERIQDEFARRLRDVELLVPYDEGGRLAELHELAGDLEREETADGVRVTAKLPAAVAARFARYAIDGKPA